MKQSIRNLAIAIFFTGVALVQTGCKEDTIIKANVAPNGDNIEVNEVSDALPIISKTFYDDSVVTSLSLNNIRVIHGAGTVVDPFFGRSNASFYMQVIPPTGSFNFSSSGYTLDSAVIILPYSGFTWGDTTNPNSTQRFRVYELTEKIYRDSIYYSKDVKSVNSSVPLSDFITVNLKNLKDSVKLPGIDTVSPHMRLKLTNDFVTRIKNDAGGVNFSDNEKFLDYLKGIYIEPETNQNGRAIPYFFLDGSTDYTRASIAFYFREDSDPNKTKTVFFNFTKTDCAHYNHITRNYTGTQAKTYFDLLNSAPNTADDLVLLQNEPGAAIDLRIQKLQSLPKEVINKAQLIFYKVKTNEDDVFTEPNQIYPVGVNIDGTTYTIRDREPVSSPTPLALIDGKKRTLTIGSTSVSAYIINIPREVQKAITEGKDELHLRINGTQTYPGAYRLVAGGRNYNDVNYRIKFNVTYSKLN